MKSNILQCLEYNYKKLGFDDFNSLSIEKIPTGKRNNCFLCTEGEKKIFCKEYNPELKWATQFNRERYDIEKEVINLLTINDCLVPKIVYADDNNKVLFLEYIEGKNFRDFFVSNGEYREDLEKLIEKTLFNLSRIHDLKNDEYFEDRGMEFRSLKPKDYSDKIIDTINLLPLTNKKRELNNDDKNSILKFCNIFGKEKLRYGHMELHLDNIIIANKDKEVYFVDFEKFHPHVIQLDIISLLTNPDIINYYKEHYKESINRYINYYMDINKIVDKKDFLYILDIANIIYNLKMINMIDRNNKGYKTKWISEGGESRKKEIKTDTDFGKKRNSERNENINIRIENIISLNFSNNLDIKNFKEILMYE